MIKKIWAVFALAMVFTTTLHAQETSTATGADMIRYTNTIQSVTPQVTDNKLELVISGVLADGCQADTQIQTQRVLDTWFIDLYRDLAVDQPCTKALLPFEVTVDATELLTLDANATLPTFLVINARIYYINRAQIEPSGDSTAPIIAPILSETIVRGEVLLDSVTIIHNENGQYDVQLTGNLPDGCRGLIVRSYPNWQNPAQMMVEVYRGVDIAAMCAAALVPFDETLPTGADVATVTEFVVNGVVYAIDKTISANTQTYIPSVMGVDTVQISQGETPTQWILSADGITDGCELPIQIIQGQTIDNFIYVSVVRVIMPSMACPMIAKAYNVMLEINTTGLTSGTTYTVVVNNDKSVEFEF